MYGDLSLGVRLLLWKWNDAQSRGGAVELSEALESLIFDVRDACRLKIIWHLSAGILLQ
jgi:hypothetical protein